MTNEAIGVITYLLFSIVVFWRSIISMIEKKNVYAFLPFVMIGILACFHAAFIFYQIIDIFWWAVFGSLYLVFLLWIIAIIIGRYHGL
jgi:energy-coupling factor transporter transmembrane protein EcfT